MIKKLLVGLAVLSCTISPQSSFAAENGTAAIYHLGSQAYYMHDNIRQNYVGDMKQNAGAVAGKHG